MIEKVYEVTLSHKLPTGDLVVVKFGTRASVDDTISPDMSKKLFEKVYAATLADIKSKIKKDKLIKTAYYGALGGIRAYEIEKDAIAELDNL